MLHVAVLRRNMASVVVLLELDFPVGTKNQTGWKAMDEAIAAGSHAMVRGSFGWGESERLSETESGST